MKCLNVATAIAFLLALQVTAALAQNGVQQPGSIQKTALESYDYYGQDDQAASPSDKVDVADPVVEASCGCEDVCDTCCDSCNCRPELCCCEDDPWRLFCNDNCAGINVQGWVDAGVTFNDQNNPSRYNGVLSFNDRDEDFQLNQWYLFAEKKLDNDGCGWAVGGRVDLLYGTDSRFTEARGLETHRNNTPKWNSAPRYGLAMPQAYLEVGYNDLSVKLGHFYTIVGYESVMAPANFFYSHAFTMQYGEPFTHTGALASYSLTDCLTVMAGIDRGWDNWEDDDRDQIGFLGGVTWCNGCGTSVALSGTLGSEPYNSVNDPNTLNDDRYFYSLVISHEFSDRLSYVFQHDLGQQQRGANPDAEWYGINQYLFYKLNCCWTAGARFEWFRDDDGFRVAAVGDRFVPNGNPASAGGYQGDFYELTLGVNWSPNSNLIVRPELRFDWFDPGAGAAGMPYGDNTSNNQTTLAIDGIFKY